MLRELCDLVDLIAQCPEHVQKRAARALSSELQAYEDWVSLGCPDERTYRLIRMQRVADRLAAPPRKPRFTELWEKRKREDEDG